jgi:hypothetical protein
MVHRAACAAKNEGNGGVLSTFSFFSHTPSGVRYGKIFAKKCKK